MKKFIWMLLGFVVLTECAAGEGLRFRMLDVGMAECIIVTVGDEAMVVDTAYVKNNETVHNAMEEMNVDTIKYLVLTHPHADHIGGAREILNTYSVEMAILPPIKYGTEVFNRTLQALQESGTELVYPYPGDIFKLGDATITVYGPHPIAYENENNWSIVLLIEYADRRILLTGDAEVEAEFDMLEYSEWLPLEADILKVGHHGSNTSSSYQFIAAVSPEYAIISCGNDGNYPHVDTAITLFDCGVSQLMTTEMQGDIQIHIYENGMYTVLGQKAEAFSLIK